MMLGSRIGAGGARNQGNWLESSRVHPLLCSTQQETETLIRRHAGRREADEQKNESRRRRANPNTEQWDSVSPLFTSLPVPGTDHSLPECDEFKTWL